MSDKLFRNPKTQATLEGWYERFLGKVHTSIEQREVPTSWGRNHVLVAGEASKLPLVCLHGSLASSAHILPELEPLLEYYQIFAPDLPCQSAKGLPVRLPFDGNSHAKWLTEVLDGLELAQVNLLGISWGEFVALQTACIAPQRVKKLVLLVPAGIVIGSIRQIIMKALLPMLRTKLSPSVDNCNAAMKPMFTTWSDDWTYYKIDATRGFVLDFHLPPLVKALEWRDFDIPTLVFAAENDLLFPGEKLIAHVRRFMPHAETELIPNSNHTPPMTDEFRCWFAGRVHAFLAR